METLRIIAGVILMILPVLPAFIIPKNQWNIECWFYSGGAVWLLFLTVGVADLIRYLFL